VCLSLAIGNSLLMWLSVIVVTSIAVGSVLMSVLVLLTGGACIVVGFRLRLTGLRHYGLTLVLLSVLKLAVVDVASQNSIIRVISLAAAGVEHAGSGGSGAHVYSYDVAVVGHDCILPSVSPRHCGGVRRWIAPLAMDAFPAQTIRTAASPSSPDTRTGVSSAIAWAKARSSAM